MRFVILIFIFLLSDLVILLEVFADKNKKDIERQSFIKWEKVQNNRSNNLEKIIWKSYNNDESYFEKKEYKVHSIDEYNEFLEKNINNTKRQSDIFSSEIQPYLPLNNFIEKNKFETKVEWKSSFDGGEAGGTGQQNNSFRFDYGINENMQLSTYFSEADDVIYKKINGGKAKYFWQNYSLALKNKIFKYDKSKLALSLVSTIEYWRSSSGSNDSKSIYNQNNNTLGKDEFNHLIGAISLPLSKQINNKLTVLLVPGITFLPEKMGTNSSGKNSYGNNFYVGTGLIISLFENLDLMASYTSPLGPGNNYFDSGLVYSRKSLYSFGLNWEVNSKISLEGKITNAFGATPSTGLLTIPGDNVPLYSANIVYKYDGEDTILNSLGKRDKLFNFGGITVSNALIPRAGTSQINLNYDAKGNFFGQYGYSLSNIFQLEILNVGTFKGVNQDSNKSQALNSMYLNKNNLNYRIGGKLLILSPQKNDPFWMSIRTSFGRNNDTNQGYLFSEFINTFRFNDWYAFNVSAKYFLSGVKSFGGIGVSSYLNIMNNLQLIPEINATFKNNPDFNSSITLRYSYQPEKSIDLYYSNAIGIQDVGQLLEDREHRFGIKMNFLY